MIKSPLKWAGGKSWAVPIVQHLRALYPDGVFCDPFGGSGVISFNVAHLGKTMYSDINWDLYNFFLAIRTGELQHIINNGLVPFENDKNVYYNNRKWFNNIPIGGITPNGTRAALFYYLNRTGFNGLCRYNRKGQFNVPFGRYATINYRTDFTDIRKALGWTKFRDVAIAWANALNVIHDTEWEEFQNGFYYLDPPYMGTFTAYAGNEFGDAQQERLVYLMAQQRAPVLYHNSDHESVKNLLWLHNIPYELVPVRRSISANGDRPQVYEILAYKNITRQQMEDAINARETA